MLLELSNNVNAPLLDSPKLQRIHHAPDNIFWKSLSNMEIEP